MDSEASLLSLRYADFRKLRILKLKKYKSVKLDSFKERKKRERVSRQNAKPSYEPERKEEPVKEDKDGKNLKKTAKLQRKKLSVKNR